MTKWPSPSRFLPSPCSWPARSSVSSLLIIIGIRRGDRARRLADAPHTQVEAVTRRVLGVGTRNHPDGNAGEED